MTTETKNPVDFALNLTHDVREVWPHRIWQVLFNIYRNRGGDLERVFDMLCDFDHLKRWLEESSQKMHVASICWHFGHTGFTSIEDASIPVFDENTICIVVNFKKNVVEFTDVEPVNLED